MKTEVQWEKIGKYPHHGICVALFSLRSENSLGIGEFIDLIPLIDFCQKAGFDVIQLLPINDSGNDPSPYNPLSSCALDPIYLNLAELGIVFPKQEDKAPKVLREDVLRKKLDLLFAHFKKEFSALSKTAAFLEFQEEHLWLKSYAEFKVQKDTYLDPNFFLFLQFHCFRQMAIVKKHAEKQKVFLKGDIPILISRDSADVWAEPHLFDLSLYAGAPPDYYQPEGQNWGFPLMNWETMQKEDYRWWKMRLKTAAKLYHIYRIDHVVGFFRIWGIPKDSKPAEGSFYPPDQNVWEAHGTKLLEMMIDASPLLPIAEDLGTIPKEVYPVLKKLGICGTKVMRWEKTDGRFTPLNEYEPISMTTLATHDMDPIALWWKIYPTESIPFAEFLHIAYDPILSFQNRMTLLKAAHHTSSLFHINPFQEYLALIEEFAFLNLEEAKINNPGTLLATNWTFRFKPKVEELAKHTKLIELIKGILS